MVRPRTVLAAQGAADRDRGPGAPSPALLAWCADGVRQAVLSRVLPVQRHDLMGPLSVMRMSLGLLKRRLGSVVDPGAADGSGPGVDLPDARRKLADIEGQMQALLEPLVALRLWDAGPARAIDTGAALGACIALLHTPMSLQGHRIADWRSVAEPGPLPRLPVADFHYGVLGLLLHLLDSTPPPTVWSITLQSGGLEVQGAPVSGGVARMPMAQDLPGLRPPRPIDAVALGWLVEDLGWTWAAHAATPDDGALHRLDWSVRRGGV